MHKRQFLALVLSTLAPSVVAAGALPLLPVFAAKLGAAPNVTGIYLASAYLAVTAGTLASGWFSDRFGRQPALLATAGVLGVPATWAMGQANSVWALTLWTAAVWFLGGVGMTLTGILAGRFAGPDERGKVYGFLSLAAGLGGTIGGLITGPLVDRWGYPTMFALLSLFFTLWPAATLVLRAKRADRASTEERPMAGGTLRLGKSFYLLFAASVAAAIASFASGLGRSLSMNALGFGAAALSSTEAVGSALTLPLPPLIGWLSDRLGRKRFLLLCYLVSAAGLVLLSLASALWHFWVAVALRALAFAIATVVGPALVTDLAPRDSLGRGLSLYGATNWIGAVIGFAGVGQAVQHLGLAPALIASAALPLISILLLAPVQQTGALPDSATGSTPAPAAPKDHPAA